MASVLRRLCNKNKENFTTEALAAAIRSDPRPFLKALGEHETTSVFFVGTQLPVEGKQGYGILDLVVEVGSLENRRRYWFEVKVNAGEHGDQIEKYLGAIDSYPEEDRPRLRILGPRPLREDVQWISWQSVRDGIESTESVNPNPYWNDLKVFLEEIGMADSFSDPFTSADLVALRPASSLLGKVARLFRSFVDQSKTIWEEANWPPTEGNIRKELGKFFVRDGVFAMNARTHRNKGVAVGVCSGESTGNALLRMWIWLKPMRIQERDKLWKQAGSLDTTVWSRVPDCFELLSASRSLCHFEDAEEATGWLLDRLRDLAQAGVLGILPTLGVGISGEGDGEDEVDGLSEP